MRFHLSSPTMIRRAFTPLFIVLVIARLGPLGPNGDLSNRFVIMVHNLYHMCCKQVYILLENSLILLLVILLYPSLYLCPFCLLLFSLPLPLFLSSSPSPSLSLSLPLLPLSLSHSFSLQCTRIDLFKRNIIRYIIAAKAKNFPDSNFDLSLYHHPPYRITCFTCVSKTFFLYTIYNFFQYRIYNLDSIFSSLFSI